MEYFFQADKEQELTDADRIASARGNVGHLAKGDE
jgi:hypothetical protein